MREESRSARDKIRYNLVCVRCTVRYVADVMLILSLLLPFLWGNSTVLLAVVGALSVYFYVRVKKRQSYWKEKGIKYAEPTFFIGNIAIWRSKSIAESIQDMYNKFKNERYYGMYQFIKPAIMIRDPNLIKLITVKEFDHFVNHGPTADADTDPLWSRNLVASRDNRWRDLRSTLSPSFTSSKMKIMFNLMDECAKQFIEYFRTNESEAAELEMKDAFSRYTNDVIATTAFGLKCDSLKDKTNQFYLMGKKATNFGVFRMLRFFIYGINPTLARLLKIRVIPTPIADYFSKMIEDTIKTREEKHIVRPDMIHLLLEAQKGRHHQEEDIKVNEGFSTASDMDVHRPNVKEEITLQDIISQAFIFFLAGFDTASALLTFLFYELAVNPDIQDRLREELQEAPEKITYEALLQLRYLDLVVSETLRKWPPSMLTDREVNKSITIPPERPNEIALHLEEGTICYFPIYAIHRDPDLYPDPDKFDPERFNEENKHKINSFGYLPFGAGPRNCIGSRFALLESKLIIYHVLKNFKVVPTQKTTIPLVLDKYQVNPTAQGGVWLSLIKI